MPRTYTKLIYHCTFSTKDRVAGLYAEMRPRLFAYLARLINQLGKDGIARGWPGLGWDRRRRKRLLGNFRVGRRRGCRC